MQAQRPQPGAKAQPVGQQMWRLAAGALLAGLCGLAPAVLPAQAAPATATAGQKPAATTAAQKPRKHTARQHRVPAKAEAAAAPSAPVTPPAPKPPDWPVNDKPTAANVVWDSHGLQVVASNSSLGQILKDVALAIGARLQGFNQDQRVFGSYGPGPAREVIAQLLNGSGYNVLMVGDQGKGAPRQIVLSTPGAQGAVIQPPAGNVSSDDADAPDSADEEQPQQPEPIRQQMPPRTPQQIQQQFQQRMEQMRQRTNQADQPR